MQEGLSVGVAGFEPAASCSQSRRDNRATLHPEIQVANILLYMGIQNIFRICFLLLKKIFSKKNKIHSKLNSYFCNNLT